MGVGNAHQHRRLRHTDRGQPLPVPGVRAVAQVLPRQSGGHHRRFALAVNLHQARPHHAQSALDVSQVHRRAAINNGLERRGTIRCGAASIFCKIDQTFDDGGSGKSREWPERPAQLKQLGRIDAAGGRNHVAGTRHQVRNGVEPGAVRHRRRIDDDVW